MIFTSKILITFLVLSSPAQTFGYVSLSPPSRRYQRVSDASAPGMTKESMKLTVLYSSLNRDNAPETLYDILQIDPNATPAELKKQYFNLARNLHPDAQINIANSENVNNSDRFVEVATAYKVLSDPLERKRYDRSLKAEAFTQDVEKAAADVSRRAAPYVKDLIQNLAAPLFRRTGATTKAFIDAATEEMQEEVDFTKRVESILTATNRAGKAVDRLLLLEKSRELKQKAMMEMNEGNRIKGRLFQIRDARLSLGLKIPDAPFTSEEAHFLLDSFNTTESKSLIDYALLKHTAHFEIGLFKEAEEDFLRNVKLQDLIESDFNKASDELDLTKKMEQRSIRDVERLKRELNDAQNRVLETRKKKTELWQNVTALEEAKRRSKINADRASYNVEKRRGLVKTALARKESEILKLKEKKIQQQGLTDNSDDGAMDGDMNGDMKSDMLNKHGDNFNSNDASEGYINGDESPDMQNVLGEVNLANLSPTMKDFNFLKKEEAMLKIQSSRSDDRAARLRSRSLLLRKQSEYLQKNKKN